MKNRSTGAGRTEIFDPHGHAAIFFGSDAPSLDSAGYGVVDGSTLTKDLESSQFGVNVDRQPDYFHIIPEVDLAAVIADIGVIKVQLIEQDEAEIFELTAKQLLAFAGQPMPYRIKKVYKIGTTEDFSIIW
jgi:hypothetical protein